MKRLNISVLFLFLASCTPGSSDDPPSDGQTDNHQQGTSTSCSAKRSKAEMVQINSSKVGTFCIDRYEAHQLTGSLGDIVQNSDDTQLDGNGSTTATVGSEVGQKPLTNVSWYQAKAACLNSGAHLCTQEEWEEACRGGQALLYPYGNTFVEQRCNDSFFRAAHDDLSSSFDPLQVTGSFSECQSAAGVYDLSGNIEEWVATAAPSLPDSEVMDHRLVRGGSYRSNTPALQCVNPDAHQSPNEAAIDRGFRCCLKLEEINNGK